MPEQSFRRLIIFIPLLLSIFASAEDSIQNLIRIPTEVKWYYESDFLDNNSNPHYPDSSLDRVHQVNTPVNLHYNYLAVNGSPADPQLFHPGFHLFRSPGIHSFDIYLLNADSIPFFKNNKRF